MRDLELTNPNFTAAERCNDEISLIRTIELRIPRGYSINAATREFRLSQIRLVQAGMFQVGSCQICFCHVGGNQ